MRLSPMWNRWAVVDLNMMALSVVTRALRRLSLRLSWRYSQLLSAVNICWADCFTDQLSGVLKYSATRPCIQAVAASPPCSLLLTQTAETAARPLVVMLFDSAP